MKKVFISHPYADNPTCNKVKVDRICKEIVKKDTGILPVSPLHLFSFLDNDNNSTDIMDVCKHMICFCDEIWMYGDSKGCIQEYKHAKKLGIKAVMKY